MTPRPAPARLAAAALLLAALLPAGCAGLAARPAPLPGSTPQVLVTLPPGPPPVWERHAREIAAAHGLYLYGAWTMRSLGVPCIVYGVAPGERLERVVRRLTSDPRVESAQPVHRFEVLAAAVETVPPEAAEAGGDPYAHLQHGAASLRLAEAHRWATGRGVRVAVIDTGVDVTHPDLAPRIVKAANFVDHGGRTFTRDVHGTAVAGLLAAVAGNGVGIAGVAPEAELVALKACAPRSATGLDAVCDSYSLAQAIDAAIVLGARVINLSLTGPEDPLLARLLARGIEGGATVVAAADPRRADRGFPASMPAVIAVAAAEDEAVRRAPVAPLPPAPLAAPATSARPRPAPAVEHEVAATTAAYPAAAAPLVVAPGVDLLTTVPGGGYDFLSGSSLAAAQVAGVVALLLERAPDLPPAEVARRLLAGSRRASSGGGLDACFAVAELADAVCP